ncbi:MAG: hypothetical protein PSW75_09255 [bacterium]|nr:hypothetical protein [bacterium]
MKSHYTISSMNVISPAPDREVALFTAALQSPVTHAVVGTLGVTVPASIEITHNTGQDDPPDIYALGLGWECTEFPPNQSALDAVQREQGETGLSVPGYSQTGSDVRKIRELANPFSSFPKLFGWNDEVKALKNVFLERVIGGPKSKDVPGNDVLLLDQLTDRWPDAAEAALRQALMSKNIVHIRAILLIRWEQKNIDYSKLPVPVVVQIHP